MEVKHRIVTALALFSSTVAALPSMSLAQQPVSQQHLAEPDMAVATATDNSLELQQPPAIVGQFSRTTPSDSSDGVVFVTSDDQPISQKKTAPNTVQPVAFQKQPQQMQPQRKPEVVTKPTRRTAMQPLPQRYGTRSPQIQLRGQGFRRPSFSSRGTANQTQTVAQRLSETTGEKLRKTRVPLSAKLASQSQPAQTLPTLSRSTQSQPKPSEKRVSRLPARDVQIESAVYTSDRKPTADDQQLLSKFNAEWESTARPPLPTAGGSRLADVKSPAFAAPAVEAAEGPVETLAAEEPATRTPEWVGTLVEAHKFSQQAKTQDDYTKLTQLVDSALEGGAAGESAVFGRELAAWALNRRGELRSDEGQDELANADFAAALKYDGNCWRALHNRGVTAAQSGEFAAAFDDFNQVIVLNPKFAKAYSNRATLYLQAGKSDLAKADYLSSLKLDAGLAAANVGLGRMLHVEGQLTKAVKFFDAAIDGGASSAEVFCSRADLLADLGQYDNALTDYAKAVELNPDFAHAYRNGAWLLATCPDERFRDSENALSGAEQALKCGYGERHVALDTLAAAQANAGQFELAQKTIQQAIASAPQSAVTNYHHRLARYQAGLPFRTQPIIGGDESVQQAGFRE
ncbi:tetratricopeptide repeat protein [Adhaeretor mobilis]|uniref:Lipoprotein NlpI n=1 Tax=Adhaeretor mobilis TaxID=1930276 RepID=A0A517MQ22_9BACT|nr:tetratricopeptide repeat protein [Adhaeretor mobilis]QDS96981.1 lipoprotein NlpI [Adhaeretor mobilis]